MTAIEKVKEALALYAYKPTSAMDRPQTYREVKACAALAALEAEKPAEDMPLDRLIGMFANAWRDKESRAFLSKFFIPTFAAEKPAEDAFNLASRFVGSFGICGSVNELANMIERYAEAYHERKMKEL